MKHILLLVATLLFAGFIWQAQAQQVQNSPMEQIAMAKAQLKSNPQVAEEAFGDILKGKNKKNPDLIIAVANAYLENGNTDLAAGYLEKVMELNNKYAPAYVLAGDIALVGGKEGEACSKYEQAIYFDPSCHDAYMKYAHTYETVNPALAIEMLLKLQTQDPSYMPAYKALASVYYVSGQYGKSKEAYDRYFAQGTPDARDLTNYGMVLFLAKDYSRSLDIVRKGLVSLPDNRVLKRLTMYNCAELKRNEEGIAVATDFFSAANDSDKVYLDYLYYGRMLAATGKTGDAVSCYEKALKMEPGKTETWKELAEVYEKAHDYEKAINAFSSFLKGKNSETADLFLFGRLHYYAGSPKTNSDGTTGECDKEQLAKADSLFAMVAERVPDNYLGVFWRARTNSLLDPETTQGLAKPYYESALAILEAKTDMSKSLLIECESYLGYYYFVKNDFVTSKEYWNKILLQDPENQTAKKALEGIK